MVVLDTKEIKANQEPSLSPQHDPASIPEASAVSFQSEIAMIAYFKAESRGFLPGYELSDWFEAEQELKLA